MTQIPIIFSGPMVRALLEGRKTMTRRLAWRDDCPGKLEACGAPLANCCRTKPSPWQKVTPGDGLWVRENYRPHGDGPLSECTGPEDFVFMASADEAQLAMWKWRPSIHLPKWASRLTMVVTATKLEPLQAITDEDAKLEGIVLHKEGWWWDGVDHKTAGVTARGAFYCLWSKLHGKASWDANPQVVALTCTVYQRNIDEMGKAP